MRLIGMRDNAQTLSTSVSRIQPFKSWISLRRDREQEEEEEEQWAVSTVCRAEVA
jgi:hypothetical protein